MQEKRLVPMIDQTEIREINRQLALKITDDYSLILAKEEPIIVLVTLKGALFFAADLMREIGIPSQVDFVRVSSYGAGTQSSGKVAMSKEIETDIHGKHVLVLDEIVDSGRTLKFLSERFLKQGPRSLKLAALLSKPSRREVEINVDYIGREIPDRFVVGYGLDHANNYREMPFIGILD